MNPSNIAFIGGGNMAGALIGGLLKSGRAPASILVVEPFAAQRERLQREFGLAPLAEAGPALASAGTVVWAVKPQLFREAAAPCAAHIGGALQLSVMAGVRSDAIAAASGSERVVRAMPNTPALIGRGIAGLYARDAVTPAERGVIEALLAPTGRTVWVDREADLDAVTALSGSGPAYVFYVLEAMMKAGVEMGLPEAQARALALATFDGATALAEASPLPPAELRAQVTSKGGTTYAAITSMEADGVGPALVRAMGRARERARELGDEFGS
ncbi:pyrroline-5-carboxylate reductase [Rubrivivax gelatinosus]|uniref:Pyrroline-5-carboxylate reductase n=1 Tax=Rubrivivax gelatinosus TaxID=28068 RepID=A0ABS1DSM9_RUBGE|nr:pyrroline-5-carboxylate reductase [Rubrivivax gelatinosus]MBK1712354.1 pyrroline-5-carboxylate reductase [Rubrivivax gelatinosus]